MKKNKKRKKTLLVLIILMLLAIIGLGIYYYYFYDNGEIKVKVLKSIPGYDYHLNDNETSLYKEKFEELEEILTNDVVDDEEYAKKISELFIIDFYTLDNKLSKNDIGGTEFVEESIRDNFIDKARSTFYRYLEVKENRKQVLPVVSEITSVEVEKTTFKYSDKTIDEDALKVSISWDYEEDLGYEDETIITIIKKDDKLYIVEMN